MNDLSKPRKNRRRMALDEPYRSRAAQVGTGVQRFNQVRLDHQDLGIGEFGRRNPDDFNRPCLQQRSLPGVSAIVNSVWEAGPDYLALVGDAADGYPG